ncbi:hypothetical protein C2S51_020394 [Perilla frutescens var. frutescens]|nr:hypothetical protein C2S51_020394 [Perilla frutescens var. frutescens]
MGVSKMLHEMDSEKWDIDGIELRRPLKPVFTRAMERSNDEEEEEEDGYNSTTPTCAESRIPSRLPCPPAPMKRKAAASRCHYARVREFFCPPDLETVFIRRVEGA